MGKYRSLDIWKLAPPPAGVEPANDAVQAVGEVTIFFGYLEDQLSHAIGFMVGKGDEIGRILTAEISFKVKVQVFASLARATAPPNSDLSALEDLCGVCQVAEGNRNLVTHSTWVRASFENSLIRTKFTAKVKNGLQQQEQKLHVWQIMEITTHLAYVAECVDEFMEQAFGAAYVAASQ